MPWPPDCGPTSTPRGAGSPARTCRPGAPHTLAPPSYGGRHVLVDTLADGPPWLDQLNADPQRRIAAGLGASYVRANQEDLMAKAWEQVGAIREANRLSNLVELTTGVAERLHDRHVAPLTAGETVAFAAPAAARARLAGGPTLDLELRMSRLPDGAASTAFSRRVRPGRQARPRHRGERAGRPRARHGR